MRMLFNIFDVDELSRSNVQEAPPGVSIRIDSDWRTFRRYRPDYVAATDQTVWDRDYYNPVASVPWSGFVMADDAFVLQDNLTLVGEHVLIGRAMMYPFEVFPYVKDDMVITPAENGQWQLERPDEVQHLKGTTLSLVVDGWRIYGHWLVDMLPKLERALRSGIHIDQYLLPAPSKSWQFAMLDAVGLPRERCVFVDLAKVAVRCEHLVVPTYDRFNSEVRPDFIRVHERLRRQYAADIVPEIANRNLFVARAEGMRTLVNRQAVEDLAIDLGFEIIRPETMTLPEQIRLFASARSIMGECGSALNNAVFSLPGTHVAALQNADHPDHLQAQIALLKGQNIYYALGEPAGDWGAFHVPLAYVRAVAERLLTRPVTRDIIPETLLLSPDEARLQS
ncbi:glycosyltransferase family 61 protein [Sphingomonas abietis]|uniref:Glycosyltransferase 61 family protein n=1 Tax=Sphingomonas abietis TaxID=3012344 RepID=A0ABY7NLP1_9SPHN|nr:glycosyltransferase 61 family protein [Sphingomonas abietis]WBO22433.1 glycosyltransferase 61 family protein [Sphingomonas abietis]